MTPTIMCATMIAFPIGPIQARRFLCVVNSTITTIRSCLYLIGLLAQLVMSAIECTRLLEWSSTNREHIIEYKRHGEAII